MDVFQFINSKDIAAHLKSIDYPFSALEIAFLISQSEHTTLKQRTLPFPSAITASRIVRVCISFTRSVATPLI